VCGCGVILVAVPRTGERSEWAPLPKYNTEVLVCKGRRQHCGRKRERYKSDPRHRIGQIVDKANILLPDTKAKLRPSDRITVLRRSTAGETQEAIARRHALEGGRRGGGPGLAGVHPPRLGRYIGRP